MATVSHESGALPERQRRIRRAVNPEMWPSLAIAAMWLAVLLDALFGPSIVSTGVTSTTSVPSAVVVALFAYLGTRVVARYGFDRSRHGSD
jgi:hypothetical protein